ncbi:MAG: cupredoxin domain-containing protein [Candidatus Bathyarchaeia archaeon]
MPRRRKKRKKTLALLALILIIWAAGVLVIVGFNPFNMQGTAPTPVVVIIQAGSAENPRLGFTPSLIKIVIGVNNTVIWKNEDVEWHTAHSNIPEFDSKMIPPGTSFTHTFQRAGSYPYHCDPHPWMTGLIIVAGSNPIFAQQTAQLGMPLQVMAQVFVKSSDGTQL